MRSPYDDLARLVRWYPPLWRERYGDELIALCEDVVGNRRPSLRFRTSLAVAGLRERAYEGGLVGRTASEAERTRTGALVVLCAWTLFVLAGAGFAKLSEHADTAVPAASRWRVNLSYDGIEALAVLAGFSVVAGALVALPPFIRYLKAGGWPKVRPLVVVVAGLAAGAALGGLGLAQWAHHLSAVDRDTGAWPYGVAFLAWAATVAIALVASCAAAVVAARKLTFSMLQLRICAVLAYVVVVAMGMMTIAVIAWWTVMGAQAPWFLHGTSPGQPGSMFDLRVATMVAAMALADAVAVGGLRRIGRHPLTAAGS